MNLRHLLILLLVLPAYLFAQEPVDLQAITLIKQEGFDNSQVMETMSYLTDVHGPRLTGSPKLMDAMQWSRDQLKDWGLQNSRLEPWGTFGRGWHTENYSLEMLEPTYLRLIAYPKAWTPGTEGVLEAVPIILDIEDDTAMDELSDELAGAIVLLGKGREMETDFEAAAKRYSDEELSDLISARSTSVGESRAERRKRWLTIRAKYRQARKKVQAAGAALVIEQSTLSYGIVRVGSGGAFRLSDDNSSALPTLVLAGEQYLRIVRLAEKKIPVKLRASVQNTFVETDTIGYNVIAEIPGRDRKLRKQVVMLGAHVDSWHAGTGATDNAAGSAVMMEAVRILSVSGLNMKRTVRLALWTGEEQGLLGSRGYVKKTFGESTDDQYKAAQKEVSAYYNLDNGTGKIRGIYLQGNDAARPIFEAWFAPFADHDAHTVSIRKTGSTDHIPFDNIGIPGFQFIQDPIAYFSRTWHTNMDAYDYAQENDLMHSAVVVASLVYHTANRSDLMPRKPMPQKGN